MVINKLKSNVTCAVFLLPALVIYLFFAILPLVQGFWLSTTNWDGSAPWTPAQMPIADFESQILEKTSNPADQALLLKYYIKDVDQGTYRKQELIGLDRYKIMNIFSAAEYVNPDMKMVGLQNYADIFTGKLDARFFPESYQESKFQAGAALDGLMEIPRAEFEGNLLPHLKNASDLAWIKGIYRLEGDKYLLDKTRIKSSELDLQSALAATPGLEEDWESLYNAAQSQGEAGTANFNPASLLSGLKAVKSGQLGAQAQQTIGATLDQVWEIGRLKSLISQNWFVNRTKMGVIVFTVVFVVCNVILVNVIALLLALALDLGLRRRNLLRSVFFIPNVLSMIIVAFIWQLVFTQMLPAITGIHEWMMNPDLAPWLTILVATWQGVGYYMIIYLAGLQGIPTDIVESASLDGAIGFTRFRKIVLPLLVPAITICLFLSISGALKTFDILFALYPNNGTAMGVDNIAVNIYYDAFRDKHAGLANAKAIILMFLIMIISGTQLVLTKRKEVEL